MLTSISRRVTNASCHNFLTAGKAVSDDVCESGQEGLCVLGVIVYLFRNAAGKVDFNQLVPFVKVRWTCFGHEEAISCVDEGMAWYAHMLNIFLKIGRELKFPAFQ